VPSEGSVSHAESAPQSGLHIDFVINDQANGYPFAQSELPEQRALMRIGFSREGTLRDLHGARAAGTTS
jgi:hypothetical protein